LFLITLLYFSVFGIFLYRSQYSFVFIFCLTTCLKTFSIPDLDYKLLKKDLHVVEDLGLLKSTPINAASNNHSPKRWRILLHRGRFSANILGSI